MLSRSKQDIGGHTLSLLAHGWSQIRPDNLDRGRGCRCIVHAVVGGEGGDQQLPARPDRRPCRSLRESAGSGGPPTPSSSLQYCGQDAVSRCHLCHMPTTLRYISLRNLPCSTAPALPPFAWILFYFRPLLQSHLDLYYY